MTKEEKDLAAVKPEVPILIGGKRLYFVFDHWAQACLQEDKGEKFFQKLNFENLTIHQMICLTWALLLRSAPYLDCGTPEDRRQAQRKVAQWIEDYNDNAKLYGLILKAVIAAQPQKEKESDSTKEQEQDPEKKPDSKEEATG